MKTKYPISSITLSFLIIIGSTILIVQALAQKTIEAPNIQYPVEELGNCENEAACRVYCDKPGNMEICLDFAQKNNLMSAEEIQIAKNFITAGGEGPGGCTGKEECEEYCNDISHIDECISFAEKNNLIPPEELEEAKKVQAAIKRGVKPPPCGNKKQCDIYCDQPEHMEECITFGIEAGFIQGKELEDVQKMLAAVKRGVKPPPCRGKEACDQYCSEPDNMEVCMTFAMEAGFMSEQEKADSQKILEALKKGIRLPNCRGKKECDVYCGQEEHFEECMNFAEAAGFMSPEDAAMARKTGGKGPSGCKGKEECEAFCNNPDNQETCFNFAKEHGLILEEDLKMIEEGKQKFQESLNQAPPEVIDCLNSAFGNDMMEKFKSGSVMPSREIGDQMRQCFEKMGPLGPRPEPGAPGEGGMIPPAGQSGPGGCQTPDECKSFCETNPEECKNFGPGPGDSTRPEGMTPSGPPPEEFQGIMPPPNACQGENCQPLPPQDQIQPYQQQPPVPQTQPIDQQPPIQWSPPPEQQPLPPSTENPSPLTELVTPASLFQVIIRFFFKIL